MVSVSSEWVSPLGILCCWYLMCGLGPIRHCSRSTIWLAPACRRPFLCWRWRVRMECRQAPAQRFPVEASSPDAPAAPGVPGQRGAQLLAVLASHNRRTASAPSGAAARPAPFRWSRERHHRVRGVAVAEAAEVLELEALAFTGLSAVAAEMGVSDGLRAAVAQDHSAHCPCCGWTDRCWSHWVVFPWPLLLSRRLLWPGDGHGARNVTACSCPHALCG